MGKLLSSAILLLLPSYTFSADLDSLRNKNIRSYKEYFFLWPVIKQRSTSFEITNQISSNPKLTYRPNVNSSFGIGMHLFRVSFELSLSIPTDSYKQKVFGHSNAKDYQLNILSKGWGVNVFTQQYNGFYQLDSGKPTPAIYPQRPDISTWNTGANGIYLFDKNKYSLRAAYNFSERQLKSGGSFLLSGNVNTFSLRADSSIYGTSYKPIFGANADFNKLDYTVFSVAPGYAHTFVFNYFFVNGSLAIGPAQHWVYYQSATAARHESALNSFVDLRLSAGYNSDRFFAGMSFVAQSRNIKFEQIQFTNTTSVFRMVVGYRIGVLGILKKSIWDFLPFGIGKKLAAKTED
ncbi:MAG: DUF4421 family protein [Bacteroidetes bacterium]|nr:DUF4421 family protein [Bacteroidota bacterium]